MMQAYCIFLIIMKFLHAVCNLLHTLEISARSLYYVHFLTCVL
ncbi:hypothetical protein GLYMA_07G048150v4 [Glycine max]|nr:hypothetical protein GLYMA_07G048150v4 [Glycine max]KAH1085430.1 hypothetical protein GYH30_017429 [Glycine max]